MGGGICYNEDAKLGNDVYRLCMFRGKRIRQKIGEKTFIIGLGSLAVLMALAEEVLSFPDHRTTIGQVLYRLENRKSVKEYFEELKVKELSSFNLQKTLHRLEAKGLIKKTKNGRAITPIGKKLVKKFKKEIDSLSKWDGKWRLITFDVPEKKKNDREWIRYVLKNNGFKPMHKSVFIGKHALPARVYGEIYERKLVDYVRFLTVSDIDEEKFLER